MQQFAGRVYGPIFAVGQAFWQLGEGNYWGHNAIIRTRAFAACCGLPVLPGTEPFGGHILSHDFVEAALLRRAGWQVWMAPDLGGSYEESPPTLVDFAKRDRRWCQGNLQHLMVLPSAGLHPVSRLHLVIGIMSYVSSPLWFGFLMAGLAVAVRDVLIPPQYFPPEGTLFPDWPVIHTALAEGLFAWAFAMLIIPRLLGVAVLLADPPARRASGGALAVMGSAALEILFSTVLAPVMMVFQTTFVFDVLRGRDSGWTRQRREDGTLGWREAMRVHRVHLIAGLAIAAVVWTFTPSLLVWLSPVIAGLVLSPALSVATASRRLGLLFRRLGLFVIPEEAHPPWELSRTNALAAARTPATAAPALSRLLADPAALAVHLASLPVHQEGSPGDEEALASALTRIAGAGGRLDRARLTPRETTAVLFDAPSLMRLAGFAEEARAAA
jgi:membrane glycosyltransferase